MGFKPVSNTYQPCLRGISMSVQRKDHGRMKWVSVVLFGDTVEELGLEPGSRVHFLIGNGEDSGLASVRPVPEDEGGGYKLALNTEHSLRFGFSGTRFGFQKTYPAMQLEERGIRDDALFFRLPPWFPRYREG